MGRQTHNRLRHLETKATKMDPEPVIENLEERLQALAAGAPRPDERVARLLDRLSDRELLRIAFPNG
jgi:hypothetical protein